MADQADSLRNLANQARLGRMPAPNKAASSGPVPSAQGPKARVLAVSSGKGGVGKTSLSVNLALSLAKAGHRTLLFDADLGLANADVMLGLSSRFNLGHFFKGQKALSDVMAEAPFGLKVVCAGSGLAELADLGPQDRERLLSHFLLLEESFDYIVVDTGAGISRNVTAFALCADTVLVVATPEPTSRLDAYGLVKVLHAEGFEGSMKLVVNMADSSREAADSGKLMGELATRFLGAHLEYLGYIPRDRGVSRAVSRQTPFTLLEPQGAAALAVQALAQSLGVTGLPGRGGFGGLLGRLGAKLKNS